MHLLKKILLTLPVFIGIYTAVFFLQRMIPGNPADLVLGPDVAISEKLEWAKKMGLDKSLPEQYIKNLVGLTRLDFGKSYTNSKPVFDVIFPRLLVTSQLAVSAFILSCSLALLWGATSAYFYNTLFDRFTQVIGVSAVSLPSFVLGPLLLYFFSVKNPILPLHGNKEPLSLLLPSVTLALPMAAYTARMIRAGLIDVLNEDFIRTAISKGLSRRSALIQHGLKNAFLPALTIMGLQFGVLLSGTVLTETLFGWPGLGSLTVEAVQAREYPVVSACVLVMAFIYVLCNLTVDAAYKFIDPRVGSI